MATLDQESRRSRFAPQARTLIAVGIAAISGAASAGTFDFLGIDASYSLQGAYVVAVRTEAPSDGIINAPPAASIPLPTYLKVPESNNYDDGDRSFKKWTPINNRMTLLGEIHLTKDNYDLIVRGDAFYDNVYRRANDNRSPDTINKFGPNGEYGGPNSDFNHFTKDAERFDGMRGRLLDAYISGNWQLGDESALNLRVGRQVAAWGESLFFDGIALTQGPADATKATVPGADVKSILLPVNQIAMQLSVNSRLTLLGQYKLEYKPTELNPVGEFFSVADVVGPGRQFIYGIYNPLDVSAYSNVNLTGSTQPNGQNDIAAAVQLIDGFLMQNGTLPSNNQLTPAVQTTVNALTQQINNLGLPAVTVPQTVLALAAPRSNVPKYVNVKYAGELRPSNYGQYGLGMRYAVTPNTTAGLYYLRYHDTTPSPVQNYGNALLVKSPTPGVPDITTGTLGITVPVTYNIKYFDGIKMGAASLSTELFGANIGAEAIYRDGVPVLVNVDGGITGPIPTPSRSRIGQLDVNALYIFGSTPWWDAITLVADVGTNKVFSVDGVTSVANPNHPVSTALKYNTSTWGYSFLWFIDHKNIFPAWDLQIPMTFAGVGRGHGSLLSGLGALMGPNDRRASVGVNFTYLQQLQLGVSYSAYFGSPNFTDRPYQDRDNLGVTVKYNF
ncbi:MAG: DUF1302 family protein [Nevskiaceae bacterium]|nr:MAG: DUF1302 family protein [Nevskiaceae bacterium]